MVEVRESKVLKESAVRLVSPDGSPGGDMQRLYKVLDQDYEIPKKILEVNRRHSLIIDLARLIGQDPGDELINLSIEQLYDSALLLEGLHPNPASMIPRVQQLLEIAANRSHEDDEAI